jgi:hypothetical protein
MFLSLAMGFLNSALDRISLAWSSTLSDFFMTVFPPKTTGPERLDFWEIPERTDLLSSREREREDSDYCRLLTSEWIRLSLSWKD